MSLFANRKVETRQFWFTGTIVPLQNTRAATNTTKDTDMGSNYLAMLETMKAVADAFAVMEEKNPHDTALIEAYQERLDEDIVHAKVIAG